jgi:peptidoglycan/LPS O-acetylase OafA/YrhL
MLTRLVAIFRAGAPAGAADVPEWVSRGRVPCLDGLRGVAILAVLLCHMVQTHGFAAPWGLGRLGHYGSLGVDLFFTVSGFIITLLLMRELARTRTLDLRQFYLRRMLRLMPASVVFSLAIFGLTRLHLAHLESRDWIGVLTYTVNFLHQPAWEIGHLWSLAIEEHFYLLWPPILLLLGARRARWVTLAYLAAAPVLRVLIWGHWRCEPSVTQMVDSWTFTRADCIAAGALLALCAADRSFCRRFRFSARQALALGVLSVALLLASRTIGQEVALYQFALGYTITAACMATLVWLCVNHAGGFVGRLLHARWMVAVGTASYSIYLWQQIFLNPRNAGWACQWPLNLVLALGAGFLSCLFIEAPFLRLKVRCAAAGTSHAPAARGGALKPEPGMEPAPVVS